MDKTEMIRIASIVIDKRLDYEGMKEYMYGFQGNPDDVWEYVMECDAIGTIEFNEKYFIGIE